MITTPTLTGFTWMGNPALNDIDPKKLTEHELAHADFVNVKSAPMLAVGADNAFGFTMESEADKNTVVRWFAKHGTPHDDPKKTMYAIATFSAEQRLVLLAPAPDVFEQF